MPEASRSVVVNTTPLITLSVATGSLDVLRVLYDRVIIPHEVMREIQAGGQDAPGTVEVLSCDWIETLRHPQSVALFLRNTLDIGEAAVIQAAMQLQIPRVCIDEKLGRRVARLSGLTVTGSIGILAKAKRAGFALDVEQTINRLRAHGIWLGRDVEQFLRDTDLQ